MILEAAPWQLENIGKLNIILGKNGSGKSQLLRSLDTTYGKLKAEWLTKYVSPERGGELAFNSSVEHNMRSSDN